MRAPVVLSLLAATLSFAAPPGEVPRDAVFGADRQTFSWSAVPGATSYDVYRGTDPSANDPACRVYRSPTTNAGLDDLPAGPGSLFYFLVTAVGPDGEGTLGSDSSGAARPNGAPCLDADADLVPDNLDNCPLAANASQADQDGNGTGDRCDPNTYDFEGDAIGQRPVGVMRLGGPAPAFTVKDLGGDLTVSFDGDGTGAYERFDRVLAGMPLQDTTVWLDVDPSSPETCSIELWSDGSYAWNAGTGAILQIGSTGGLTYYDRFGRTVPSLAGPALPADGRLRMRIEKGSGNTSTLHLDSWSAAGWLLDVAAFPIADDHRYRGLGVALGDYLAGRRAVRRITVVHQAPATALTLRKDPSWSSDWKLFQRDAQDRATVPLRFYYRLDAPGRIEARVVRSSDGNVLPGHDWSDHTAALAAADGASGSLDLAMVPAGGNYDVEVRLVRDSDGAVLGQGTLAQVAVGDVFLAAGQSNMSGYSGNLDNPEAPVDEVHLFHNDYTWKRASEPMDDGTDQVDLVSAEAPLHTLMLRFAKEIWQATGIPVAIIPGPLGGTNLYGQWQRNEADHDDRGTLYGSMLFRALVQNFGAPVKGFLWYQGESDAGRGTALYRADLKRLLAEYREDLGNPGLLAGIVQLATYDAADLNTWMAIQEAQRQVVVQDPLAVLSAAVDLPRADSIHLNVVGYKRLGVRLAAEMREQFYGQPVDASARLTEARAAANGGAVELVYDANVVGGATGLYQVSDSGGVRTVTSVSVSGNVVTVNVQGRLKSAAIVSYGTSRSPTAAWVKDAQGGAVACFQNLAVAP